MKVMLSDFSKKTIALAFCRWYVCTDALAVYGGKGFVGSIVSFIFVISPHPY